MIQISKFAFFNSVLPSLDIGTDIRAFLFYLALNDSDHYHPKWAILTIYWVFNPFLFHVGKFFYELATTRKAGWFELLIHVPLVQPLWNLYLAWKLYKLRFGFHDFKPKDWAQVKIIRIQRRKDRIRVLTGPLDLQIVSQMPRRIIFLKGGGNPEGSGQSWDVGVFLRERAAEHLPNCHRSQHRSSQSINVSQKCARRLKCLKICMKA